MTKPIPPPPEENIGSQKKKITPKRQKKKTRSAEKSDYGKKNPPKTKNQTLYFFSFCTNEPPNAPS